MISRLLYFLKRLIVQSYALLLVLVVGWTGYAAVDYLYHYVFYPQDVPAFFEKWEGHLEASALREPRVPGVTEPTGRAPISHYHGVQSWFHVDPHNSCTTSGCHNTLPHNRSKAMRSFANLHATFLACEMCHMKEIDQPADTVWLNLNTARKQPPPATLQLVKIFETEQEQIFENPSDAHPRLMKHLDELVRLSDGNPVLKHIRVQMQTTLPGSPVWRLAVRQLISEIPNHARGEYGAKIALAKMAGPEAPYRQELEEQTVQYLDADEPQARQRLRKKIHDRVNKKPEGCLLCHGEEPSRMDFLSLGYTEQRARDLKGTLIAEMIQNIYRGQPFYLPRLLESENER
jgi:hypothetical protein